MAIDKRTAHVIKNQGLAPTAPATDSTAPSAPGAPELARSDDFSVTITFSPSASIDVARYVAYADGAGTSRGESAGPINSIVMTGLTPGAHSIVVHAVDHAGNFSNASQSAIINQPKPGDQKRGVFGSMAEFLAAGGAADTSGPVWVDGVLHIEGSEYKGRQLPLNLKMPRSIVDLSGSINAEWVKTGTSDASIETLIKAPNQTQSLRISVPGGGSNTTLTKELSAPVVLDDDELITFLFYTPRILGDATSQQCSMWLYMNSGSTDRYSLNVNLGRNSSYVQITVKKSDFTANGAADWQNINRIRFQISAHATLHREIYLLGIYAGQKARATFCLTVDDSTLTDFSEIDAYCWPRGVPVTYCIIPSLIDNNPNYLTSDKLPLLKAHGNSLICHDSSNWEETYLANPAGFSAHLDSIKAFVAQYDPDGANFSSLPEGRYGDTDSSETAQVILSVLNQKFLASRLTKMTSTGMALAPIFPSAYEYQLLMSQLSESDNEATWKAEIDSICAYGNQGIGYIHRVVPGVAGPVEINRDVFRAIVDYLCAKRDAGLVDLVSFPDLYRRSKMVGQQFLEV